MFFFFSSRRRHTRFDCDWSSDVCSSDLAFDRGELSLDKARQLCRVATPADEEIWLDLAHAASGSQLERICRAYRRAMEANDPVRSRAQLARRGLWSHWDEHGMLQLRAALPPEDG